MSTPERPISEDDLHAYVDDLLDPARRSSVLRYLEQNHAAAERVAAYVAQRDQLRAAFAPIGLEPVPSALNLARLVDERLARRHAPWRVAAAVALAIGAGGAGGWLARSAMGPPAMTGIAALEHEAAASHLVYATDPSWPAELGAAQRDGLTRWESSWLNHPIGSPDLAALGYRFIGGRLVATGNGAAALLLYENSGGSRLSIFARPMRRDRSTPILALDIGNLDGCAWIDKGIGYALIADQPYKELVRMSRFVRLQLDGRT